MLKELINTLGKGFATLGGGTSMLTLFPTLEMKVPVVLDSLNLDANKSLKNLSNEKLSPWEQDSINFVEDMERVGADFKRVMSRLPLGKTEWSQQAKNADAPEVQDLFSRPQIEAGVRLTLRCKGVEFVFSYCPPGFFTMESPVDETGRLDDEEQRVVTIDEGFWICETETTQEQWNALGIKRTNAYSFKGAKLPVENVSWFECEAFVEQLNKSCVVPVGWRFELPTEEQWEYACRAGVTNLTNEFSLNDHAWYSENSGGKTREVGTKKNNRWGIYDMLGNVWEWTKSQSASGELVVRGGSWRSIAAFCSPTIRDVVDPSNGADNLGFRVVLVPNSPA